MVERSVRSARDNVTATPGRTAPEGSLTVPRTVVLSWAIGMTVIANANRHTTAESFRARRICPRPQFGPRAAVGAGKASQVPVETSRKWAIKREDARSFRGIESNHLQNFNWT